MRELSIGTGVFAGKKLPKDSPTTRQNKAKQEQHLKHFPFRSPSPPSPRRASASRVNIASPILIQIACRPVFHRVVYVSSGVLFSLFFFVFGLLICSVRDKSLFGDYISRVSPWMGSDFKVVWMNF